MNFRPKQILYPNRFFSWRSLFLLLPIAGFSYVCLQPARSHISTLYRAYTQSDESKLETRIGPFLGLIREVQQRVPPGESILIDVSKKGQPELLYWDRVVAYWLYPRKVYSSKALELQGIEAGAFVERNEIHWIYRDNELLNRGPPGLAPASPTELPCSLHDGGIGRTISGIGLALLHFMAVGMCLLGALGGAALLRSRSERVAAAYLIGTGAVGCWVLFCFATGLGVNLLTVLLSLPLAALIYLVARRRSRRIAPPVESRAPDPPKMDLLDWGATLVTTCLLVFLVVRAVSLPMQRYDDRYQWAHKAHIMLHESSVWGEGFQDPHSLHFHPKYPLLVPSVEAVVFTYTGGFNDQYPKVLFPLFLGALLVIVSQGLAALGRTRGRGLAVLAFLMFPFYWGYGIVRDGAAAFTAYADIPLSVFLTAAMIYFLRGWITKSPRLCWLSALLLLFTALTKSEGMVHVAVFIVLAAGLLRIEEGWNRFALATLAGFAIAAGLVVLHYFFVTYPTQTGILPDNYPELLGTQSFAGRVSRLGEVARRIGTDLFLSPRFGFLGWLLVVAGAIWGRTSGKVVLLPLSYVALMSVLFVAPYILLPEDSWEDIYNWSAGRLIAQIVPMGLLAVTLLVLPANNRSRASPA